MSVNMVESGPPIRAALQQEDKPLLREVIDSEVASLHQHRVFRPVVDQGREQRSVRKTFVLVKKLNEARLVERYKARLVAEGFYQRPGFDIDAKSIDAPTVNLTVLRLLLDKAADEKLAIWQCDVRTALLEVVLDPPVLVRLPRVMVLKNGVPIFDHSITDAGPVVHLAKALPELRQ